MAKIDTNSWKSFRIGNLFEVTRPAARSQANYEEGTVPFVASGNYNNGVIKYCEPKKGEVPDRKGCISVSPLDGSAFYQPADFLGRGGAGSAIILLRSKNITEMNGLFISAILRASLANYSYNNQINSHNIQVQEINLPATPEGKPDYAYMDSYMRKIMIESEKRLDDLNQADMQKKKMVDTAGWKEFQIGDLFEVTRPAARSQANYEEGTVPFVASGNYNNGVIKYCEPKEGEVPDRKGCISVSPLDGSAFYQPADFLGRGGAGSAIILLRNNNITEMNGLFISAVLRAALANHSYSDQISSRNIQSQKIKLPADSDGNPDFAYMDSYMRKIMKNSEADLDDLAGFAG